MGSASEDFAHSFTINNGAEMPFMASGRKVFLQASEQQELKRF